MSPAASRASAPLVSVLIPVWNAGATLPACLESVGRQRETRFECVVVDDGSHDGSREIVRRRARRDPRFRLIAAPHAGIVAALARGLAACRAPLIARMDADDWMHRDRLGEQLDALDRDPGLAGVGCRVRMFPRTELSDGRRRYESWLNAVRTPEDVRREAFVECPLAHPGLLLRRDVLERTGWRDPGWPEDYDLVLRLLARGERLAVVPRRLLGWRDDPGRLSRTDPRYAIDRFTACKAHFLAAGLLAARDDYVLWGYGDTGRSLQRALRAHGKRPTHIVELHPGRIGQRIQGAEVIPPASLGALRGRPLLASVAGPDARTRIRGFLAGLGRREGVDFVCAA